MENMKKTCNDCIHYDVCQYHIDEETTMTVNECSYGFKDKSRYIELPCVVGDTVYCIQPFYDHDRKKYKTIIKPRVVDFVFTMPFMAESNGMILKERDFGKTVFLTKEEAEQVLKGGNDKCLKQI